MSQTITLDANNSAQILFQQVDISQKKGVFELEEAHVLTKCKEVLLNNVHIEDLSPPTARQLLIQAVKKSQKSGVIETLESASVLHTVCTFLSQNLSSPVVASASTPAPTPAPASTPPVSAVTTDADLDELSDPVPIRPRVV